MPSSPTPLLRTVIASIATADTVGNDCRLRKAPIQVDGGGLQDDAKNGGKAVAGIHERTEPKHEKGTEKRAYTSCSRPRITASQLRGPLGASEPADGVHFPRSRPRRHDAGRRSGDGRRAGAEAARMESSGYDDCCKGALISQCSLAGCMSASGRTSVEEKLSRRTGPGRG